MQLTAFDLVTVPWAIFCLYWIWASRQTRQTAKAETGLSRALHLGLLAVAFGLVFLAPVSDTILGRHFMVSSPLSNLIGLTLATAGIAFAIWARHELGQNWSGTVTIKTDHHLIRTGPYAFSRHPIYTGMFFALLGTALVLGEWRGLVAIPILLLAYLRKMQLEERWLTEEFPADYPGYRRQVKALIPLVF